MNIVLTVMAVAGICCFWMVGMANYLTIARVAGLRFPGGLYPVRVYQHALGAMKGTAETRNMLIGFGGMLAWGAIVSVGMLLMRGA